jgi:hypothetical protein
MARPRRVPASVPWLRAADTPLPDTYRMNFVIRDPELIALLVRGVPHGQLTKTLQRLMREGYDRMVVAGVIHPSDHLTPSELAFIQAGHRNAVKRRNADESDDTTAIAPAAVAPPIERRTGAHGNSRNRETGETGTVTTPPPVVSLPVPPTIGDDDANVLLGAQG